MIFRMPLAFMLAASAIAQNAGVRPAALVDPFIGTGGHGHTFPGATVPFGMVQLSPDTRVEGWDACGGYHWSDSSILGFSHTHLSGTGVGDYGDILFAPTLGAIRLKPGTTPADGYRSSFSHRDEQASPGYYSVKLREPNVRVELTSTTRVGIHRYTFPATDSANIVIDLVHGIGPDVVTDAELRVTSDREITGYRRSTGWAKDQLVYFVARFSEPFRAAGLAIGDSLSWTRTEARGTNVKAALRFSVSPDRPILIKVALSSVDVDGAANNMSAELDGWDFDDVRFRADSVWNAALARVEITGGTMAQRRTFYTALYHTMIAPNAFSDADGMYRGMDLTSHVADGVRYTVFSLWDTFRAAHPLFTILEPERTVDFIATFLSVFNESGALPVWELAANETWCMIGYHAVPVILDAYAKGIRGFDVSNALKAIKASADADRYGLPFCRVSGYVPSEKESESVSKTLEYAYDDWCISAFAGHVGDRRGAAEFDRRSQNYRNLFDPTTGFFRPKRNGGWAEPFRPLAVTNDFTEANAWQYAFFAPHDVRGLIGLSGGPARFDARLDSLFATPSILEGRQQADITGLIGQYAHGNEPSHHIAYLYTYTGSAWKTQRLVRRIMEEFYSDRPDGLIGNEDCGQMSAWYVMSAMGFYAVNPGQPMYVLGSPLFDAVTIHLPNGRTFSVRADSNRPDARFIRSASWNGRAFTRSWFSHEELLRGGELRLRMSATPNASWAAAPSNRPPSPAHVPIVLTPVVEPSAPSFRESVVVRLTCPTPGATVRYTTDGSDPGPTSPAYKRPLTIARSLTLKARAYVKDLEPSGIMVSEFRKNVSAGTVLRISPCSPQYSAGGDQAIVDGVEGVEDFRVGGWQGFEGNDLDAVIDMGSVRPLRRISARFLQDNNAWIFFPTRVRLETSTDGVNFSTVYDAPTEVPANAEGAMIRAVEQQSIDVTARYVRIHAQNLGTCPPWHKGAGSKAWLFVDEVEVE